MAPCAVGCLTGKSLTWEGERMGGMVGGRWWKGKACWEDGRVEEERRIEERRKGKKRIVHYIIVIYNLFCYINTPLRFQKKQKNRSIREADPFQNG